MKEYENKLYELGYKSIAGLDEAGRGPLAGPLVVAICSFDKDYVNTNINDSKKLSEKKRNDVFKQIINDAKLVDWIIYDAEYVDINNPKQTSINGMKELINRHKSEIDYCLIDAEKINLSKIKTQSIIKGDSLSQSIAAASIVAKVIRDKIMHELDKKYPNYNFSSNKGYGTKGHLEALVKYKPLKNIHRFSYKPIKKILDNKNNK
ncbi:MAG: ribonuclease HII [Mycoplasma sp.]|nr:ribonuclease HII [Mycoplasma sp.]